LGSRSKSPRRRGTVVPVGGIRLEAKERAPSREGVVKHREELRPRARGQDSSRRGTSSSRGSDARLPLRRARLACKALGHDARRPWSSRGGHGQSRRGMGFLQRGGALLGLEGECIMRAGPAPARESRGPARGDSSQPIGGARSNQARRRGCRRAAAGGASHLPPIFGLFIENRAWVARGGG
jgi:hypothetical protein